MTDAERGIERLEREVASLKEAMATQDQLIALLRQDFHTLQVQLARTLDGCIALAERVQTLEAKVRHGTGL